MLRYGIISEIDTQKGVARVKFEDDEIVSDWLRCSVPGTLKNKWEFPYSINEPVWCMMDEHSEDGVIGGAYYHEGNLPSIKDENKQGVTFYDGTTVIYDTQSNKLEIKCVGDVTVECINALVKASTKVTVDTPNSEFSGNVKVKGGLSVDGSTESQGSISTNGNVRAQGLVEAGPTGSSVKLNTHVHAGSGVPPTPNT